MCTGIEPVEDSNQLVDESSVCPETGERTGCVRAAPDPRLERRQQHPNKGRFARAEAVDDGRSGGGKPSAPGRDAFRIGDVQDAADGTRDINLGRPFWRRGQVRSPPQGSPPRRPRRTDTDRRDPPVLRRGSCRA